MPALTLDPSIDWNTHFLTAQALRWSPSAIRGFFHLLDTPGMLSLLAGEPDPASFPIAKLDVTIKPVHPSLPVEVISVEGRELDKALQYSSSNGMQPLIEWLTELQVRQHRRTDKENWRVCVGSGSLDLLTKAFSCLCEEGDSVLIETPVFAGTLNYLQAQPLHLIDVATDGEGLIPSVLESILENWTTLHPTKTFPKVLYTIPTGANPSGCSSPESRKLEVLRIARKFNILIMEDDAYFYLFYGTKTVTVKPRSYFELEGLTEDGRVGRVIRFDTMSKVLSSGMRIGYMTAAPRLMDVISLCTTGTTLQPNSLSQAVALALLQKWGHDEFYAHTRRVAALYKARRDMFEAACHKYLTGLATWVTPDTGMFLYLRLNVKGDGSALNADGSEGDSYELITQKAVARGVLAVPGVGFSPTKQKSCYVRVSFSLIQEEQAQEAIRRLRDVILEARGEEVPARE